jgi:hypothetical protein
MRRLLGIGLALAALLALSADEALARHGRRMGSSGQGMRGAYGGGQSYRGNPWGAAAQYRMQNRARSMACPYGNTSVNPYGTWPGLGLQQTPYGFVPGQLPYGSQSRAMQRRRMQNRARVGQGAFGVSQGTAEVPQLQFGPAAAQGPFANAPGTFEQQRSRSRLRALQNAAAGQAGGAQERARARVRVPQ